MNLFRVTYFFSSFLYSKFFFLIKKEICSCAVVKLIFFELPFGKTLAIIEFLFHLFNFVLVKQNLRGVQGRQIACRIASSLIRRLVSCCSLLVFSIVFNCGLALNLLVQSHESIVFFFFFLVVIICIVVYTIVQLGIVVEHVLSIYFSALV